jgi:steroid delta-isomerase-like uncharacterized protein
MEMSSPGARDELTAWFDSYLDALNAHDIPAVLEFMSDDVVYADMAVGERMEGRAATGEFLGRMATNVSTDYRFDNEQVLIDGELFALVWTMSGTNDRGDERAGVHATGRRFRVPGVSIGRLRDGKVVQQRDYWNMADFLSQVGLMPAPHGAAPATS